MAHPAPNLKRPDRKRRTRVALAAVALSLLNGLSATASAGRAEDAYLKGQVYDQLYHIALVQWERAFQLLLPPPEVAKATGRGPEGGPWTAYFGGLCAFHSRRYDAARRRMFLAEQAAKAAGEKALAQDAKLWAALCDAVQKTPLDAQALRRLAKGPPRTRASLHVAYALDTLRQTSPARADDEFFKEHWPYVCDQIGAGAAFHSKALSRWHSWLKGRSQAQKDKKPEAVAAYVNAASAEPDLCASARAAGHGINLWDVGRLRHLSHACFAAAFKSSRRYQTVHTEAALRLRAYDQAAKFAGRAARARGKRTGLQARIQHYKWEILRAQAEEHTGHHGALRRLGRKFTNPAFAQAQKDIYHMVLQDLAEALAQAGLTSQARTVAEAAVNSLERNYKSTMALTDYYEQARPVYAALAHLHFTKGNSGEGLTLYRLVYPWNRDAWIEELKENPLFGVRYSGLLFAQNNFALVRELVYNYQSYGLIAEFPDAAQLHSVSSTLEHLLSPRVTRSGAKSK